MPVSNSKKDKWKTLGTPDLKEARRIGPLTVEVIRRRFDQELAALNTGVAPEPDAPIHRPTASEIQQAAWELISEQLATYGRGRTRNPNLNRVRNAAHEANRVGADRFAGNVLPIIRQIQAAGRETCERLQTP